MTIDPRLGRGVLATFIALGLSVNVGCNAEDDPPPPAQDDDGEDDGETPTEDSSNDDDVDPTTGGEDPTTTGEEDDGNVDGDSGSTTGESLDPNLDRSAPNILDDPNLCGYPGPGPNGYGGLIGQNRFPNFVLEDCEGNQREFAEFFCERDDEYGDFNKAFIVIFEAMW